MQTLCKTQTVKWTDENTHEKQQKSSPPLIDPDATMKEWEEAKKIVLAEKYSRDCTWKLWSMILKYHPHLQNLLHLAKLCVTFAVQTAGYE